MTERGPQDERPFVVSGVHYIDRRIDDFKELVKSSKADNEMASRVLETNIREARAASNEIRGAMMDAANRFPDKETVDAKINSLRSSNDSRLSAVENRLSNYDGRVVVLSAISAAVVAAAVKFLFK